MDLHNILAMLGYIKQAMAQIKVNDVILFDWRKQIASDGV